jgi:hypothetical protein
VQFVFFQQIGTLVWNRNPSPFGSGRFGKAPRIYFPEDSLAVKLPQATNISSAILGASELLKNINVELMLMLTFF